MRIMSRAWRLAAIVAAGLIVTDGALLAGDAPVVHVTAAVGQQAVRLEAQANGPFQYTSYRASKSLYVLDLSGVSAADGGAARVIPSELVKGYREVGYSVGEKPMVRLEVLLAEGLQPRVERTNADDLTLLVSRVDDSAAAATAAPVLKPASAVAPAVNVENTPTPSIRQVLLSQKGTATEVSIVGSGSLTYHTMNLHNPDRLVLDFQSARLRTSVKHIPSNLDPVRDVRVAQFTPEISRVVIDLREAASYNITRNGADVTVAFAPEAVKPAPVDIPANVSVAKTIAPAPAVATSGNSNSIPASAALLPAALMHDSSSLADPVPTPAKPNEQPAPSAAKVVTEPAAGTAPAAAPERSAVPSNPAASADYSGPGLQSNPRFTGEPISVNLKNVDLQDFFRLIHEISGLNVVVDPNVKGSLTIVLDNVPWDQALDIVLRNNDLEKQLDGNVLRIATRETIKKEAEEQRDLSKAQAEAAEVVTTTRVLSYAKAADMATMLKKFLSSRGQILADDRSNTLVISDVPAVFPIVDNLIRQLDRKSRQVEIEARVVAASRSFDREFGSMLGMAAAHQTGGGVSTFGGSASVGSSEAYFPNPPYQIGQPTAPTPGTPTYSQIPLLTNLSSSVPTSGISYLFQSTNFALDAVLNALEQRGVGKLLSKPTIFTQNNEKGVVKQGTKIPVQTIVNNTVSVQFVDAVLELDVTPQITADGTIYMDVTIENDQIDQSIPRVEGIPAIDTQSAQTRVTVKDGATVVVGGIMVSTQNTTVDQVPVLGSVPVIGNLFKHKTVSSNESELLFFLTPRILPG
ncbi:MAG TPA: type IV pilus secretin PilQ [Candidatus Acidoferrum sp.]|nr:type IV pilus secretin PilQ [Candidatus Acidoferrum sp.]